MAVFSLIQANRSLRFLSGFFMDKDLERIRAGLESLRVQLADADQLAEPLRQEIEHTLADIDQHVERAESQPDEATKAESPTLVEQLEAAMAEFEESHPTLARTARNLIDALAQLGI